MTKNKGMDGLIRNIRGQIESALASGYKKFIIFPYGDVGMQVKNFLNNAYGIQEDMIVDNHLCLFNPNIKSLNEISQFDCSTYAVLLSSTNAEIYGELKKNLSEMFNPEQIFELNMVDDIEKIRTKIGRYSYGPICRNHPFIESIGSFSSFAVGAEVVENHEYRYITTHPIIYNGQNILDFENDYSIYADCDWYLGGGKTAKG